MISKIALLSFLFVTPAMAADHILNIENIKFSEAVTTAHIGDKITWKNQDLVPHSVTAKNGAFDSKVIDAGSSWSYVAKKKGTFDYKCSFHPQMDAKLIIE